MLDLRKETVSFRVYGVLRDGKRVVLREYHVPVDSLHDNFDFYKQDEARHANKFAQLNFDEETKYKLCGVDKVTTAVEGNFSVSNPEERG